MQAIANRSALRTELRQQRASIEPALRAVLDTGIAARLDALLATSPPASIAVFWPLPGEPDLRDWYRKQAGAGLQLALPVVIRRRRPLVFRPWDGSAPPARDLLNIPCPAEATPLVPDMILSPCLGFDPQCFRLGNGGGYYDMTLATLTEKPDLVGVAYECLRQDSIQPQTHDVPMDLVVTEARVYTKPNRHEPEHDPT